MIEKEEGVREVSEIADDDDGATMLTTYDPHWETRFCAAEAKLEDLTSRRIFGPSYGVYLHEMDEAFRAQFRTAPEYGNRLLAAELKRSQDLGSPLPQFSSDMTLNEVIDLVVRFRYDRTVAEAQKTVRRVRDANNLKAFSANISTEESRLVEDFTLNLTTLLSDMDLSPSTVQTELTFRMIAETTRDEVHICFAELETGASVMAHIEQLANYMYSEEYKPRGIVRLTRTWWQRRFIRFYPPHAVNFYGVLAYNGQRQTGAFYRVRFRWHPRRGFRQPSWHRYPKKPVFIDYAMQFETSEEYEAARSSGEEFPNSIGKPENGQ